jgi:hypothetical protein
MDVQHVASIPSRKPGDSASMPAAFLPVVPATIAGGARVICQVGLSSDRAWVSNA